jgi:hypothetical protein
MQNDKTPAARGGRSFEFLEPNFGSIADVDRAQAIAERGPNAAGHVAAVIGIAAADIGDAEAGAEVVMMKATAPSTTPRLRGGSRGASAIELREAAATSASVILRYMVVLLECARSARVDVFLGFSATHRPFVASCGRGVRKQQRRIF